MNCPKCGYQDGKDEIKEVQEENSFPRWPGRVFAIIGAILALCYIVLFVNNYSAQLTNNTAATLLAAEMLKPHLLCVALAFTLSIAGIVTYRNWAILISACLMVSAAVLVFNSAIINIATAAVFMIAYFLMDE